MSTTSVELPQLNNTEKNDNKEVILEAKEKELEPASYTLDIVNQWSDRSTTSNQG